MSRAYIEKDDAFRIKGVHSFFFYYIGDDQTSNLNLIRIYNFELKQKKKRLVEDLDQSQRVN